MDDIVLVRAAALEGRDVVTARSPLLGAGIRVKPVRQDTTLPVAPEMVELSPERRARLVKFITDSRLPDTAKSRILKRLEADKVPAGMVERIETRMGG